MKDLIEINTMTARNVYSSESLRFVKMVVEEILGMKIPSKASEIHKQNKPYDYTDEVRKYGTKEQGINFHSYYKVIGKDPSQTSIYTVSNQTFGFDDFWLKFTISSQDGLLLELDIEDKDQVKKLKQLFEKEFGYTRKQSKEEIFDELIHELRTRGTDDHGKVGIKLGLKAIDIEPEDFWALFYLGCSYAFNGQHKKAIKYLKKALAIDQEYYDAYYNLAKSYLELKDFEKAKVNMEKAKALAPTNLAITYYLAVIADKTSKKNEAIKLYKEAISYAPEEIKGEHKLIESFIKHAKARLKELKN